MSPFSNSQMAARSSPLRMWAHACWSVRPGWRGRPRKGKRSMTAAGRPRSRSIRLWKALARTRTSWKVRPAILIVEFARQREDDGVSPAEAATDAARVRLRPIIMTSLAFILGALPLVLAEVAGAELRRVLGVSAFAGMLGVTFFGLIFTPPFYAMCRRIGLRRVKVDRALVVE